MTRGDETHPVRLEVGGADHVLAALARAGDEEALATAALGVHHVTRRLLRRRVPVAQVARIATGLRDALVARAIALEVARAGRPLPRFCWLALGSDGRAEPALAGDQDNAIVFEPGEGGDAAAAAALLPLARRVNATLERCGIPACEAGVMAGTAAWCASVDAWRERFERWIAAPGPDALLGAVIALDLRPVYGDAALACALRASVAAAVRASPRFLASLARHALGRRPPLGVLRDFAVEGAGAAAGTIDLKLAGTAIFVDAARVLALAHGVVATATRRRLRAGGAAAGATRGEVAAWAAAFDFLQTVRLSRQCAVTSRAAANRVDPRQLNPLERRFLLEALRQGGALQGFVARAFGAVPSAA
jgi:CBS domain-containing protein